MFLFAEQNIPKIYNTLTREKEFLKPIDSNEINNLNSSFSDIASKFE